MREAAWFLSSLSKNQSEVAQHNWSTTFLEAGNPLGGFEEGFVYDLIPCCGGSSLLCRFDLCDNFPPTRRR
jgi:hypothetical protein